VKKKEKTKNEAWLSGYECGKRTNEKYARLGRAIIECLYEFFEPAKEDY